MAEDGIPTVGPTPFINNNIKYFVLLQLVYNLAMVMKISYHNNSFEFSSLVLEDRLH